MRANPQRQAVMRKIASDAVEKVFRDLAPEEEEELVTSVLRQWLTFDGHAVLLEEKARFYLILQENAESYGLTTHQVPESPSGRSCAIGRSIWTCSQRCCTISTSARASR
jgi:hypothetical protein